MSNVDMSNYCNSEENVVGVSSTDDNEWTFYSTFDAVVSQFERFHVDGQRAKQTIASNAVKGKNCSELDTTVENLTLSISAMNVASASTEKETVEIRTVSTKKSHKCSLHKQHDKKFPDKHHKRATGQREHRSVRSHRYKSRFGSLISEHVKNCISSRSRSNSSRLEYLQITCLEWLYRDFRFSYGMPC